MTAQSPDPATSRGRSLLDFLALNRATFTLLVAIFCLGFGEELWRAFVPKKLDLLSASLWTVGIYAAAFNGMEGVLSFAGGEMAHRLGPAKALGLVTVLSLGGYACLLGSELPGLVILGTLLILAWESLSQPATFDVVGTSLQVSKRTMAFALQSIQKRLPKILGPAIGGFILTRWGFGAGLRYALVASLALAISSIYIQFRYLPKAQGNILAASNREIFRTLDPFLKRLLAAEILTRWCDWIAREFVVLYCLNDLKQTPAVFGGLVALQHTTALLTYLPVGSVVDRGLQRPFIGLTFVFFALTPAALALAPPGWGLFAAFAVYGLREIGEPARKALITNRIPAAVRAKGVGLYWGLRSFAIVPAPLVGAWIWQAWGPRVMLFAASGFGALGAAVFYAISGRIGEKTAGGG